jgi:hypothetical protein
MTATPPLTLFDDNAGIVDVSVRLKGTTVTLEFSRRISGVEMTPSDARHLA